MQSGTVNMLKLLKFVDHNPYHYYPYFKCSHPINYFGECSASNKSFTYSRSSADYL